MAFGPFLASQSGPENDPQQRQLRALQLQQAQQMLQARQREQQMQGLAYQGLRGLGGMGGGAPPAFAGAGSPGGMPQMGAPGMAPGQIQQQPLGSPGSSPGAGSPAFAGAGSGMQRPPPQMGGGGLPFPSTGNPQLPVRGPVAGAPPIANVSQPPAGPSPGGAAMGQTGGAASLGLPPQQQQQATQLATMIGGQVPMGARGTLDASSLADAIERVAPPGTSDDVKGGALMMMHNLLAPEAKEMFARQWEAFKFGAEEKDKQMTRGETRREHDLMADYRETEIGLGRQREAREEKSAADLARYRVDEGTDRKRRTDIMEKAGPARVRAAADKASLPQRQRAEEDLQLADEADELREMIEQNPKLVGTAGMIGRTVGAVGETVGSYLPGQPFQEDPDVAAFANRLNLLQARLQKPLLGSRYYSGMAQQKLNEIVPGLKSLQNPSRAKSALQDISRTLRDQSEMIQRTTKGATSGIETEYQSMSDEDLLRAYRQQQGQ